MVGQVTVKDEELLGTSLKDLGKKWFAVSLMDERSLIFIDKINKAVE